MVQAPFINLTFLSQIIFYSAELYLIPIRSLTVTNQPMAKTPTTKSIGDQGEEIAHQYLESKGYTILERNWRTSTLEVDIICTDEEFLIFVEVKYRKNSKFGEPVEFISGDKMRNLSIAAGRYLEKKDYMGSIRFDVVGIRPDHNGHYKIRHLKDVHFSGWDP